MGEQFTVGQAVVVKPSEFHNDGYAGPAVVVDVAAHDVLVAFPHGAEVWFIHWRVAPALSAQTPGQRVQCAYRGSHRGTLLAMDDPRAWVGSLAFPFVDAPPADAVRDHVAKVLARGGFSDGKLPVAWDFGIVYWDSKLYPADPLPADARYHVVAINDERGTRERLSSSPLNHHDACVFKGKFTTHRERRIALEEIPAEEV